MPQLPSSSSCRIVFHSVFWNFSAALSSSHPRWQMALEHTLMGFLIFLPPLFRLPGIGSLQHFLPLTSRLLVCSWRDTSEDSFPGNIHRVRFGVSSIPALRRPRVGQTGFHYQHQRRRADEIASYDVSRKPEHLADLGMSSMSPRRPIRESQNHRT